MSVKLVAVILALAISAAYASPANSAKKSNYIEQENSCRQVCGLCDCDGFYCEDECICECNLEEDENLQCIADMKKECDANGLEYELLMQESAKERFLREVKGNTLELNKHLVILKQKRQSASSTPEPTVGAAAPSSTNSSDPVVAAPAPPAKADNFVGMPLSALAASINGKAAIAGLSRNSAIADLNTSKLLIMIRERIANRKTTTRAPITLPKFTITTPAPRSAATKYTFPTFPSFAPIVQPSYLFNH